MAVIRNKDLIQSYIMTTAKYDFNVYEKRILYCLIQLAQSELQGVRFINNCCKIEHDLFGFTGITMPIAGCLSDGDDKNHSRIKEAIQSLQHKIFQYEDNEVWQSISIVGYAKIQKRSSVLSFIVHPKIWDCLLDFTKGYRRFELKKAMSFNSQYSMRFYELLCGQKKPIVFSIEQLYSMFCLNNRYDRTNDFLRKVVDPAKKELDSCSEYTFSYTTIKDGKKITALKLVPKYQAQYRDQELERRDLDKYVWTRWFLSADFSNFLKNEIGFKEQEIKNNKDLFIQAEKIIPNIKYEIYSIRDRAQQREVKNEKGYIVRSLKNKIQEWNDRRPQIVESSNPT